MSIVDIVKRIFKQKSKPTPPTEDQLRWNHIWDLWAEGKAESPYAELMTYQSEVNNGGHSQFFDNVSHTDNLRSVMDALKSVLSEDLSQNLTNAYEAHLRLEENYENEEAERMMEACDDLFFERENEITQVLEQYASYMKKDSVDENKVRVIKISKEALFEFIYEKFIDDQEMFLEVDCLSVANTFDIDWESGAFIFCAYKSEDEKGNFVRFPEEIDLQQLMKNIPDTTTSMYVENRYREYTKDELIELSKK